MGKKNKLLETIDLPTRIKSKGLVYKNRYQKIRKFIAEFDKFKKTYFVAEYGSRAAVVVHKNGQILLTRQYRLFLKELSYEIPGGQVNQTETPKKAAIRECIEETGYICRKPKLLLAYEPDLENTINPTYIFHTNKVIKKEKNNKNFTWIALDKCMKMIKVGKIKDSLTIMAILAKKL